MDDVATTKLIWWILIGIALCIVVGVTSIAYIETLYMKAQLKQEMKELRRLKREINEIRNNPNAATSSRL
jgi:hypothetical protein